MSRLLKIALFSLLAIAMGTAGAFWYRHSLMGQGAVNEQPSPRTNAATEASLHTPDTYGYPTMIIPVFEIRKLLINKEFEKLNALLDSYQNEFDKDYRYEMVLRDAYNAFWVNDLTYEPLFDEWLKQYPGSYQPYLARASYLFNLGWTSRGKKWAYKTAEEQFAKMDAYFVNAEQDANKVIELNKYNLLPYSLLIQMTRTKPEPYRKDMDTYLKKALEIAPYSFLIRNNYLRSITPRWGGSFEAMKAFIEETGQYQANNKKLEVFQGFLDFEYGEIEANQKNYTNALSYYDKALTFGDFSLFYDRRASVHTALEQYDDALDDLNQAIALEPLKSDFYLDRSQNQAYRRLFKQAVQDINVADQLTPFDTNILAQKKWLIDTLLYSGTTQAKEHHPDAAIDDLNIALLADPGNVRIYNFLAQAYIEKNELKNAVDILKKGIAIDPNDFDSYQMMDWVLDKALDKGADLDAMIVYWNQYIASNPENTKAYLRRGGAFYRKGDLKSALNDAKKAGDLGDSEGKVLYERFKKLH